MLVYNATKKTPIGFKASVDLRKLVIGENDLYFFFDKFIIKYVAIGKTTQGQEVKFHEIKSRNNHSIS
jgi:hypothetical protein